MSHTCRALVLHCIDFRFGKDLKTFMEKESLLGDADIVALAGAAKNINDPEMRDVTLRQIEISKRLHGIMEVHLINHMDCGAYGGHAAFADEASEHVAHTEALNKAAEIVQKKFPDLKIVRWVANIEETDHERKIWFENA